MDYPGIVDSRQTGFRSIQDEESGQVGSIRRYNLIEIKVIYMIMQPCKG